MSKPYKNLIFTKHALERMGKRSIDKDKIWQVINQPSRVFKKDFDDRLDREAEDAQDSKKYIKKISGRNYQVIAAYIPKEKKYLVISTWVRGEDDGRSMAWILITLPFKIVWWILKKLLGR